MALTFALAATVLASVSADAQSRKIIRPSELENLCEASIVVKEHNGQVTGTQDILDSYYICTSYIAGFIDTIRVLREFRSLPKDFEDFCLPDDVSMRTIARDYARYYTPVRDQMLHTPVVVLNLLRSNYGCK
jgi:hypothetical protein